MHDHHGDVHHAVITMVTIADVVGGGGADYAKMR